ncbi:MAG: hypothetical protein IJ711_09845, partial [Lachnospiraceae bacterium]|nr:hypothetical protein [Lachnospiraceae bacterium]
MKKEDVISEGEAITEGLERFLDRELAGMTGEQSTPQAADPGKSDRVSEGYRPTGAAGARKEIEVYPMDRQSAPHEKRAEAEPHMADPLISRAGSEAERAMRPTETRTMGEGGRTDAELQPAGRRTGSAPQTTHRPDRSKDASAGANVRRKTDVGRKQPQRSQKGKTMKKGK